MPEQIEFPKLTTVTPYPGKSNLLSEHSAIWKHIHNWRVFSLITDAGDIVGSLGVWHDWDAIHVELCVGLDSGVASSISVSKDMLHDNKKALDKRLTDMLVRSGLKLSTSLV